MKATTLSLITALALTACGRDSSSTADGGAAGTEQVDFASKIRGRPTGAPEVGMAAGGVAAQSTADFSASAPEAVATDATSGDPLQNVAAGTTLPTMVIRTGQAFIEVEKVDPATLKIRQLAAQVGGYITNSSISGGRDQIRQATLELKIPAPKYDQAVGSLSTIGKVETVTSTAQDVGEEFVDFTARVNNSRRLEERLISLLANRTGKLDEVLRVERELARVREEIERYEGRLRYLSSRVAMSTLTITVHEPAPILGNNPGENPIATALRRAWRNFVALVAGSIAALGVAIPLALVAFGGWTVYRRIRRG
jgi:hypothetical protein